MATLIDALQRRLLPAFLAAIGVSILAAGILSYADAGSAASPSDSPTPGPSASLGPTPDSLITFPPLVTPTPGPSASPGQSRVATRVVIPALRIDLPVIKQPGGANAFPPCNVAMYLDVPGFGQPGFVGPTYIYAHARTGMFLPILTASRVNNGHQMLGMLVQVYTSDDLLFLYDVVQVRRHVLTLDGAFAEKDETLWLQTSEGPRLPGDQVGPKTQLVAVPLSVSPAAHADAHPKPNPVFCS